MFVISNFCNFSATRQVKIKQLFKTHGNMSGRRGSNSHDSVKVVLNGVLGSTMRLV